jgi:hypothetical protein
MLNLYRMTSCTLLYSSSVLIACCTPPPYDCTPADTYLFTYLLTHSLTYSPHVRNLLIYEDAARTRLIENMSREAVHCCVTSQRMRHLAGQKENTATSIVACAYFGLGLKMMSSYFCVLEHIYGAVEWQWVFTLQYFCLKFAHMLLIML